MGFTPTAEQEAIIAACREGENLVITAGAGTGKTTTLKAASERMPGNGLYLAFNKAIQVEAASKFPRHVQCKTAHSLAYQAMGKKYRARLNGPRQTARHLAKILGVREPVIFSRDEQVRPHMVARLAMETVDRFCSTNDPVVTEWHVPGLRGVDNPEWKAALRKAVFPFAVKAWENLQADDREARVFQDDPNSYERWVSFKHDHYLKLWAMQRPKLHVDFILFDEAQDANPLLAELVQSQKDSQLIAVGDSAQQLYAWRGAVDALAHWPADQRLQLSESFRFGPQIADEANKWLDQLDAELRITGRGPHGFVCPIPSAPDAVLCRTNAETLVQAMTALDNGVRVAVSGGGDAIANMARAAIDLKEGRGTSNRELCLFQTWQQLQDYVRDEPSAADLKVFVRLVDEHGPNALIEAVNRLVPDKPPRYQSGSWRKPDLVVSTGHKAKGLEWDRVKIAGDFKEPKDEFGDPAPIDPALAMLAYVAVTRAQKHLDAGGLSWINGRIVGRAPVGS